MDTKHTPGPWRTDHHEHNEPHQNIRIKGSYRTVCTVWIDDAPVPDYNAEQESNARLIAAAPELLEALKAAIDCGMVPVSSASEGGAAAHSIQVRVADQIRKAIAKAEGTDK